MAAYPSPAPAPVKLPKAGFFWAGAIFIITAVGGVVLVLLGAFEVVRAIEDAQAIAAPGDSTLVLDEGDHWVFASVPIRGTEEVVRVDVTDPNAEVLTLTQETLPTDSTSTGGEQWIPLGYFTVETAGEHLIEVDAPQGTEVRVGTLSLGKMSGFIFGGLALGFIGFVIALVILIVTLVRRGSRKKQQRAVAYAAGGGYPGGGYPGQAPTQQWPPAGQASAAPTPNAGQWPPPAQPQQWPPQDPGAGAPPPAP